MIRAALSAVVLVVALATASASMLSAQILRGTVRDSASRRVIPGVVISVVDGSGVSLARTITGESGAYRVVLSGNARLIRVQRIGFRLRELPVPTAATLDVAMLAIPAMLDPVVATADPRCPRRSDRAAAFALLEQARVGLLAIVVARESNPASLTRLGFIRTLDDDRVVHQVVRADAPERTATSFNAMRSATVFVNNGFRAGTPDGGLVYYGPDVETLLDDQFASAYCFHIAAADAARPHQIGLAFSPARRRTGRVDIEGTLWIDTVARALRDITFKYVGLGARVEAHNAGGNVAFREMPNGVVLIDRWHLRIVGVEEERSTHGNVMRMNFDVRENGGEVARASWPDGTSWRASLGTLRLHLVKYDGTTPASGAMVRLFDTHYEAIADSSGVAEIADLLPGPYTVVVTEPRFAKYGVRLETPLTFVAARDSVFATTLKVPSVNEFVAGQCSQSRRRGGTVKILGRVLTSDGKPVNGARWTVSHILGPENRKTVAAGETARAGDTDGVFELCSPILGEDDVMSIEARTKTASGVETMRLEYPVTLVTVRLDTRP